MTSDRKAKKAARARMAAAGERYTAARRKVVPGAGALPAPMTDPPDIDPCEHAIRTVSWGAVSFHLVPYQGRYYVWHCWPGSADVYQVGNPAAGHAVLDARHAFCLLTTPWDQRAAHIFLPPSPGSPRTGYEAAVIILAEDGGTWLACRDGTAGEPAALTLARFDNVSAALTAFADHASQAAAREMVRSGCGMSPIPPTQPGHLPIVAGGTDFRPSAFRRSVISRALTWKGSDSSAYAHRR
jgi:hypothetical protein